MTTYNLSESQLMFICTHYNIKTYFEKFNAKFEWNHEATPSDDNFWGTVIFDRDESLTWFLLTL